MYGYGYYTNALMTRLEEKWNDCQRSMCSNRESIVGLFHYLAPRSHVIVNHIHRLPLMILCTVQYSGYDRIGQVLYCTVLYIVNMYSTTICVINFSSVSFTLAFLYGLVLLQYCTTQRAGTLTKCTVL